MSPEVGNATKLTNGTHLTYVCNVGHVMADFRSKVTIECSCDIQDVVNSMILGCQGKITNMAEELYKNMGYELPLKCIIITICMLSNTLDVRKIGKYIIRTSIQY